MTHDTCHMSFSFACFFLDISNVQLTLILHDEALSLPVSDKTFDNAPNPKLQPKLSEEALPAPPNRKIGLG